MPIKKLVRTNMCVDGGSEVGKMEYRASFPASIPESRTTHLYFVMTSWAV